MRKKILSRSSKPVKKDSARHRAASLKQQNRKFKGSLKKNGKSRSTLSAIPLKSKNRISEFLKKRKTERLEKKGVTRQSPPLVIGVFPTREDSLLNEVFSSLAGSCNNAVLSSSANLEPLRQFLPVNQIYRGRRIILLKSPRDIIGKLDTAKVSDLCLFVGPQTLEVEKPPFDDQGYETISALKSQGISSVVGVFPYLRGLKPKEFKRRYKLFNRFFLSEFPSSGAVVVKCLSLCLSDAGVSSQTTSDLKNLYRTFETIRTIPVSWRAQRSYLISDRADLRDNVLRVTGYIHGYGFTCQLPVHVTGIGDFMLRSFKTLNDPLTGEDRFNVSQQFDLLKATDFVEECRSLRPYDPSLEEQTWPTTEELEEAEVATMNSNKDQIHSATNKEEGEKEQDDINFGSEGINSETEMEEETPHILSKNVAELEARELEDMEFPDEVDTPTDVPARVRFGKYRGLKSVRSSEWDRYENLPNSVGRTFEYQSFAATRNFSLQSYKELAEDLTGAYCCLELVGVTEEKLRGFYGGHDCFKECDESAECTSFRFSETSPTMTSAFTIRPLIISSLFQFELKVSTMGFKWARATESWNRGFSCNGEIAKNSTHAPWSAENPLESKRRVQLHCGFKRFYARPIYATLPKSCLGSSNVKYIYKRFCPVGESTYAFIFAPLPITTTPVIVTSSDCYASQKILLGSGTTILEGASRMPVIIKRILLTGYPFKVHRNKAVVRYMFFSPRDIEWFKPVELKTKEGLRGHIRQSLGLKGHMKCTFSTTISQSDTVCMALYKRVFPKWNPESWLEDKNATPENSECFSVTLAPVVKPMFQS